MVSGELDVSFAPIAAAPAGFSLALKLNVCFEWEADIAVQRQSKRMRCLRLS